MNRAELKSLAKSQIKGNIGILFLIMLLGSLIVSLACIIPGVGTFIGACLINIVMVVVYLKLADGVKPDIAELINNFDKLWGSIKVNFFAGLFTFLWSLLFWIPGIIKAFAYSMSMYILAENPDMPALEAIKKSQEMMKGHKMEYFVLQLSFFGWHLLGAITCGIAYIWIVPYISATNANFYNSIKDSVEVV